MDLESSISIPMRWSNAVLATTIIVMVILVGTIFYIWIRHWPQMIVWLKYLLTIVFVLTIVICIGNVPVRLKVNSEKITLTRLFKPLTIQICEISEVKRIGESDISDSIRTFGSGGLFGYLGRLKSPTLGSYTMYATDLDNLVLIRTSTKTYVFSCSRPNELIEYINLYK